MDVSIIIINYKTFQLTSNCIDSVLHHTKLVDYEIILVENGTAEFNDENVRHWGDKVKLIVSKENLGFAGGNNRGIEIAKGQSVLLLNSDTYLTEDSISKAHQYLVNNSQVGVVSARLVYPNGQIQSVAQRFPSIKYQLIELLRLQKFVSKKTAGRLLLGSFFEHNETLKVDWVWGAFFMFPRSILKKTPQNKLDDSYFMYFEDTQWCMDIARLGYQICFFAETTVVHIHGASSGAKNELIQKNASIFLNKNYSSFKRSCIVFLSKLRHF